MPNIEIHGFSQKEAENLRDKVFGLFQHKPYVDDMVVTIYSTIVQDKYGKDQPFIRLVNPSDPYYTEEILETLETIGIDIEYIQLKAFSPKKPT